jgi:hypothetical protein
MDDKGHIKMKINDILNRLDMIAEAPDAQPVTKTGSGASGFPTKTAAAAPPAAAPAAAPKKKALPPPNPQVMARQNELIAAGAKIKADGRSGPATAQAEKDFGAKVDAAKGSQTAGTATTITNPAQAAQAPTMSDRAADPHVAGVSAAPAANPGTGAPGSAFNQGAAAIPGTPAPADDLARMTQLAGAGNSGGYGNFTGGVPQDQAAQSAPAAAPAAQVNPDTGLSSAPKPVTTGTGGKTNMVTGSDDEMAWRAKNPQWNMTGAQYPGAGNWDPRTGRSKQLQAQADANAAAVKGFFNKINPFAKKEAPAAASAAPGTSAAPAAFNQGSPSGQGGQTAPPQKGPQQPGGYGQFSESEELTAMLKIAGLR